ncbi:MAG: hypothetical protein WBB38_13850, partial [Hyphomicrobiaceae bacterium]
LGDRLQHLLIGSAFSYFPFFHSALVNDAVFCPMVTLSQISYRVTLSQNNDTIQNNQCRKNITDQKR